MRYTLSATLFLLMLLSGCSLDIPYENQFSDPDAITTPETGRELLAYAYNSLPNPEFDLALLADDFEPTYWAPRNSSLNNEYTWQPQALIDLSASLWTEYYEVIASLNALLERTPDIKVSSEADRTALNNLTAEAYTLKAFCYFRLLQLFASGPDTPDADGIILKDKVAMENLPRRPIKDCIAEIRSLLTRARELGNSGANKAWITSDATLLLSAQVELYAGNCAEAAHLARELLDKYGFEVFAPQAYDALWNSTTSAEQIFIFNSPDRTGSFYQEIVYDTNSGDYFSVAPAIAAAYGPTDCRTPWSICEVTTSALGTLPFIGKYNRLRREKREITFVNKMRLSNALFTAAEALVREGQGAEARSIMNEYLSRRGAELLADDLTGDPLMLAILHQKQLEFLGEGERFFDLKRYRATLLNTPSTRIPPAGDYRWLLPIPKDEYLYNEAANQNPEWPKSSFND